MRPVPTVDVAVAARRSLSSPAGITLGIALGWALIIAVAAKGDVRSLLILGTAFSRPPALAGAPELRGDGYDGQFFAALATDPLLLNPDTARYLDGPFYRAGRIGLPLAAWLLAGGNERAAVLVYQLLCWAGALLGVWVAARWLEEEGTSPLWALPLGLSAGVVASVLRSLPDAAAASLVLLALWLRKRESRPAAVAVLAFACLVRETSLIAAAALAMHEARGGRLRAAGATALAPLAAVFVWRKWVESRPGMEPSLYLGGLGPPVQGVLEKLLRPISPLEAFGMATLVLAIGVAVTLWRSRHPVALTYIGFSLLSACLSYLVTVEVWAYGRAVALLPLGATVLTASAESPRNAWLLRAVSLSFAGLGLGALARTLR
jgi:hypothetical protein